jgi:hypothetical protein
MRHPRLEAYTSVSKLLVGLIAPAIPLPQDLCLSCYPFVKPGLRIFAPGRTPQKQSQVFNVREHRSPLCSCATLQRVAKSLAAARSPSLYTPAPQTSARLRTLSISEIAFAGTLLMVTCLISKALKRLTFLSCSSCFSPLRVTRKHPSSTAR